MGNRLIYLTIFWAIKLKSAVVMQENPVYLMILTLSKTGHCCILGYRPLKPGCSQALKPEHCHPSVVELPNSQTLHHMRKGEWSSTYGKVPVSPTIFQHIHPRNVPLHGEQSINICHLIGYAGYLC